MLTLNNKEVFNGLSRKQIDERGGLTMLVQAREKLVGHSHRGAHGFSIADRARLVPNPVS